MQTESESRSSIPKSRETLVTKEWRHRRIVLDDNRVFTSESLDHGIV